MCEYNEGRIFFFEIMLATILTDFAFHYSAYASPVRVLEAVSLSTRKVGFLIPGPVKSDTMLPTACYCCDVLSTFVVPVLPRR